MEHRPAAARISSAQLPPGAARGIELAGVSVALFRDGDSVHALDDMCPHSGGPLSEGAVDGGCVTCPWHGARFELATGRSVGALACADVRVHLVRAVSDGGPAEFEVTLTPRARFRA